MMEMNRRSFMKKVGGALAGVLALGLPSKKAEGFNPDKFDPKMANIDSNSEWAKQKPLTLAELIKLKEELDVAEKARAFTGKEGHWHYCIWHNYQIWATDNHIAWHKLDADLYELLMGNTVHFDLPIDDVCNAFETTDYGRRLWWIGDNKILEIVYVGGEIPFKVVLI